MGFSVIRLQHPPSSFATDVSISTGLSDLIGVASLCVFTWLSRSRCCTPQLCFWIKFFWTQSWDIRTQYCFITAVFFHVMIISPHEHIIARTSTISHLFLSLVILCLPAFIRSHTIYASRQRYSGNNISDRFHIAYKKITRFQQEQHTKTPFRENRRAASCLYETSDNTSSRDSKNHPVGLPKPPNCSSDHSNG